MTVFFKKRIEPEAPLTTRLEALERAMKDVRADIRALEGDLEWLSGDLAKMRGKITGGMRGKNAPESPQIDDQPVPLVPGTPDWFAAEAAKLRGRNGR